MTPAGIKPATFRFVAQHLKHCATAVPEAGTGNKLMAIQQLQSTGRFIMFSVITNIYNTKTKGPTLMELFTATGKLKKKFFLTTGDVRCVHHW